MTTHIILEIYEEGLFLTKSNDSHNVRHPVSPTDVIAALADMPIGSSLLPPNALFWQNCGGAERIAIYVPAKKWEVTAYETTYKVPFPQLIFVGHGKNYKVFAVKKRPDPINHSFTHLYEFPGPNVGSKGAICNGNVPFPVASSKTIYDALNLFMGSGFNHDNSNGRCRSYENSLALWQTLDGKQKFPTDELISIGLSVRDLLSY